MASLLEKLIEVQTQQTVRPKKPRQRLSALDKYFLGKDHLDPFRDVRVNEGQ